MKHYSTDRYIILSHYKQGSIRYILTNQCVIKKIDLGHSTHPAEVIAQNNFDFYEASQILKQAKDRPFIIRGDKFGDVKTLSFTDLGFEITPVEISVSFFL